jgi:hypothetical protein
VDGSEHEAVDRSAGIRRDVRYAQGAELTDCE